MAEYSFEKFSRKTNRMKNKDYAAGYKAGYYAGANEKLKEFAPTAKEEKL